ncbi:MAG: hypothetical protein WC997_02220 [Porticoccaceae bacterium]
MSEELQALCQQWQQEKRAEQVANAKRVKIEGQILALAAVKEEGSATTDTPGFKITTTGKLSRKMDWEAYQKIAAQIPDGLHPVKTKQEIDEVGVKWLQKNRPDIYSLLPLTVTPAKTAVSIKAVEVIEV